MILFRVSQPAHRHLLSHMYFLLTQEGVSSLCSKYNLVVPSTETLKVNINLQHISLNSLFVLVLDTLPLCPCLVCYLACHLSFFHSTIHGQVYKGTFSLLYNQHMSPQCVSLFSLTRNTSEDIHIFKLCPLKGKLKFSVQWHLT